MACYDNIIGIARADCPCAPTAPPTGYNTSNSGLYLLDQPPFNEVDLTLDCSDGSIWDIATRARSEGVTAFINDSNSGLMAFFKTRRERFKGTIGESSGRETLSTTHGYAGARIACNPIRGGKAKITEIVTVFSAVGTVAAKIYNSLNEEVWTGTLTTANGFHVNTISPAIELPTFIEYDSKHQYFLVAAVNPSNLPKLNEINCGCGGFVPWFNTNDPMWKNKHNAGRAWANWVMAGGWSGDTLTDFDRSEQSTSTRMNGFALKIELGCDVGAILCSGTLDFTNDPLALSIAYAIYWKSLELLATKSLGSTKLTRTNLVNREFLQSERDKWSIKYEDNLRYIIQEASMSVNDCLVCRDESGLHIATARS